MKINNIEKPYQICSKTVMDSSDPGIKFDENGVCDHVYDFDNFVKPNWDTSEKGKAELDKMFSKIKAEGKGKDFDCLLGLSGGVDSSYLLHMAVKEFGLKPLVFHVDGGWNSELAVHNINVLIEKLGLDLYTEVINWEEMKDFQLAFFKSGLPHPMQYYYYGTDMIHIRDIIKKFGTIKMKSYPFSSVFRHKIYLKYIRRIKVVKPLNSMPYYKQEAIDLLEKEYGWKPYPQKHFESRFTRFFEGYWLPKRFGFDPRRVMLSSLILTDQMSRDEALEILKKPAYDPSIINDDFKYIATKLNISEDQLTKYMELPKKYYWDYKNQDSIFRLGAKILRFIGGETVKKRNK